MDWLAWIVLVVLALTSVLWLVRRFRSENRRLDGMIRDFNRQNPRHEPAPQALGPRLADLRRRR